jgi:TolA-binding protein
MKIALVAVLLLSLLGLGCSGNSAEQLFETAELEERQNNHKHAKQLYREVTEKYPNSPYAKKAQDRLSELNRAIGDPRQNPKP